MRLETVRVCHRHRVQVPVAGLFGYVSLQRCEDRTGVTLDMAVELGVISRFEVINY